MKFLDKIHDLNRKYSAECCGTKDKALLYDVYASQPPLAKHIVFSPMPEDVMQEMINNYKRSFPEELLTLFRTMNGASLFWIVHLFGAQNTRIPLSCLTIYGIPLTYDRKHIEPLNISIEDLSRPHGTPENWLKFGSYYRPDDMSCRLHLYVDTDGTGVYAVKQGSKECCISKTWATIDHCLCDVFDLLEANL